MKPHERQSEILHFLQNRGRTSIEELTERFNTTGTTIRKDLVVLEKTGMVIRTYGGVLLNKVESDQAIHQKALINTKQKKMIAEEAIHLIHHGDFILFDTGSTVLPMIPLLKNFTNLTVMTNCLQFASIMAEMETDISVWMPGGTLRKKSASFHGQITENALKQFNFDKLFIGTDGIDLDVGITTFHEIYTDSKAMCNAAKEIIVLADSSKFGRKSPNVICPLSKIDIIITDNGIKPETIHRLQQQNIKVIVAGESNEQ